MKKINLLNTLLIVLSFLLAFLLPFKLLLLSYAILGPLHYLTEINWIKNKDFFVEKSKIWLISCCFFTVIITIPLFFRIHFIYNFFKNSFIETSVVWLSHYINIAIFLSLYLAIILSFKINYKQLFIYSLLGFLVAVLLIHFNFFHIWIGLFLPTIIHVYVFTILFMLYGSFKDNNPIGYINILLLLLTPLGIYFIEIKPPGFSENILKTYVNNNFHLLNIKIAELLNLSEGNNFDFLNIKSLKIQMFISFAYTYHYLNWFSKTTVIGWYKKTTTKQLLTIGTLWLLSIIIYFYDYRKGFILLFFLSFIHVLLEFPLNILSIKGIAKKIFRR
ncbi:hypothetical protein [Polaribacter sp. L3A8]|uniref:hypothetical protein n=1 Tax=Polaribacter sp. L3A8 TaxID=2686361 RepID=UPI00131B63F5|nr:hypothetical protein [Polaribacter sp. L3A8]